MGGLILCLALVGDGPLDSMVGRILETAAAKRLAESIGVPEEDVERRLPDGRRVDILDREAGIAWEVEWVSKWPESIGQAIGYATVTDLEPGIWLLFRPGDDERWNQCQTAVEYLQGHGIPLHVRTEVLK